MSYKIENRGDRLEKRARAVKKMVAAAKGIARLRPEVAEIVKNANATAEWRFPETVEWTRVPLDELAPEPLGPVEQYEVVEPKRLLPTGSDARKKFPIGTGFMDYFPDAIAAVAEVSYIGNQKHNPGEPTHWARGKSMDHADCIPRHYIERGGWDTSGPTRVRHSALLAWRAMALLQEELEKELGLDPPRGAWA